jgi:hypothetical protein
VRRAAALFVAVLTTLPLIADERVRWYRCMGKGSRSIRNGCMKRCEIFGGIHQIA